jgi:hypothetical protein
MGNYRFRLTINVTHDEYAAFMELARIAKTSPSALGQHAIRKVLADGENAIPFILPAASLPETIGRLEPFGSYFIPLD